MAFYTSDAGLRLDFTASGETNCPFSGERYILGEGKVIYKMNHSWLC
jgi:hypothetical protein